MRKKFAELAGGFEDLLRSLSIVREHSYPIPLAKNIPRIRLGILLGISLYI